MHQGPRFALQPFAPQIWVTDTSSATTLLHGITEPSGQFADYRWTLWNLDGLNSRQSGRDALALPVFQGVKFRRTTGNVQEASKKIRSTAEQRRNQRYRFQPPACSDDVHTCDAWSDPLSFYKVL
jgi:hypothetical protein